MSTCEICETCEKAGCNCVPCQKCEEPVEPGFDLGGKDEWLCEDCFTPSEDADEPCADCGLPVYYCDVHEAWEHTTDHECFMNKSSCKWEV